jgi:putative transposase
MRIMGISSIYPKPRLSKPGKGHKIYPYLLKGLKVNRPNQVWVTDITYIPMTVGHCYFIAIMDLYSRRILSYRLSNSLDTVFCTEALNEAIEKYGSPEIVNTDQGSQFTSDDFTSILKNNDILISMDGKARWVDNVFIERFWRSLKYEDVYIHCYETIPEARVDIPKWIDYYNSARRHSSLGKKTPDECYFKELDSNKVA